MDRLIARLGIVTLAMTTSLGCELIWPEVRGWTAEPTETEPAFLDFATTACLVGSEGLADHRLIEDQRGPDGAAFLWLDDSEEAYCLVLRSRSGALRVAESGYNVRDPDRDQDTRLRVIEPDTGDPALLRGMVDDGVAAVEITTQSGRRVVASSGGGRFIAWWPADDPPARVRTVAGDGATLEEITL